MRNFTLEKIRGHLEERAYLYPTGALPFLSTISIKDNKEGCTITGGMTSLIASPFLLEKYSEQEIQDLVEDNIIPTIGLPITKEIKNDEDLQTSLEVITSHLNNQYNKTIKNIHELPIEDIYEEIEMTIDQGSTSLLFNLSDSPLSVYWGEGLIYPQIWTLKILMATNTEEVEEEFILIEMELEKITKLLADTYKDNKSIELAVDTEYNNLLTISKEALIKLNDNWKKFLESKQL